ncbi:MAG TPA: hypothetical protein VJZ48_01100 [Bacilli bacterium]|nr:hypothetical protein [Bacilli bacterium]
MRKLYLVNEVGTPYFLDYKNNTLIETIDGLGYEFDIEYQDFADKFVENKRKLQQRVINVTLIFLEGYEGFTKWREYVTKSKELRLFYSADGLKYCYVNVQSTTKSQLEASVIRSAVRIECLSLWLIEKSNTINVIQSGEGKTYPYRFAYVYSISFNGMIIVSNECVKNVPLKIKITGNVLNPRVIIRQNGEVVSALRLLVDERENPVIEISSDPTDQYIRRTINGQVTDIYQDQDFSYDNFLYLPPGLSEIFFDPGVREPSTCEITYQEEYIAH